MLMGRIKLKNMTINFIYHHNSGEISYSFMPDKNEEAIRIGFGVTCEEAERELELRDWLNKESLLNKQYKYNKEKPFIALMKKRTDDKLVKTDKCINALENYPPGAPNQITQRTVDF